jgi:hypothetical protein
MLVEETGGYVRLLTVNAGGFFEALLRGEIIYVGGALLATVKNLQGTLAKR